MTSSLQCLKYCTFYVDLSQYLSPCLVTGDDLCPDMLISFFDTLYVLELNVGFEANLNNSVSRKFEKYRHFLHDLHTKYRRIKFVNLSISSLGIFGQSCDSFIQMCSDLSINTGHTSYIVIKLTSTIIHTTCYVF